MHTKTRAIVGGFAVAGIVALLYVLTSASEVYIPPPGRDVLFSVLIPGGWFTGWLMFGKRWDDLMATLPKREK